MTKPRLPLLRARRFALALAALALGGAARADNVGPATVTPIDAGGVDRKSVV